MVEGFAHHYIFNSLLLNFLYVCVFVGYDYMNNDILEFFSDSFGNKKKLLGQCWGYLAYDK